jgi:NADH dehydrogenase
LPHLAINKSNSVNKVGNKEKTQGRETMTARLVTVFGGNGFVGRHVVQRLAGTGVRVRVAVRDPESALFLKPLGAPGQIVTIKANITSKEEVARAVDGADAVVNCVGVLTPSGWNDFHGVHKSGSATLAKAVKAAGIKRLVHISALNADRKSQSPYLKSKAEGEEAIFASCPEATVLRPSVIVGAEDKFLNLYAKIARWSPVIPMINPIFSSIKMVRSELFGFLLPTLAPRPLEGCSFQPVVVADVAEAVVKALDDPSAKGQTYDVTGPTAYTFKKLMQLMLKASGREACVVSFPATWAYIWAFFIEFIPGKPFTCDMVTLLNTDNLPSGENKTLADLGIQAHSIESVLPSYLSTYRPPSNRRLRPV